jgi:hypothetical protein
MKQGMLNWSAGALMLKFYTRRLIRRAYRRRFTPELIAAADGGIVFRVRCSASPERVNFTTA